MLSLETANARFPSPTPRPTSKTNQLFFYSKMTGSGVLSPFLCADRRVGNLACQRQGGTPGDAWLLQGSAPGAAPAFGDLQTVSAPKDFGIKFLNLECEFLRHEMYSECGFLRLTKKQLWEGRPGSCQDSLQNWT